MQVAFMHAPYTVQKRPGLEKTILLMMEPLLMEVCKEKMNCANQELEAIPSSPIYFYPRLHELYMPDICHGNRVHAAT